MASSSSPPASAISPSSSSSSSPPPPPSSSLSPLPSASQLPNGSQPPVALNSPPPPMPSTSPPTSFPNSPPPTSTLTPPSSQADPPLVSPPPPSVRTLPPPTSPASSPPPPLVPALPPPTPTSSPPPPSSTLPPPAPPTSSPPPPLTPTLAPPTPPTSSPSPPSPPFPTPPTTPVANPPVPSPPSPVSASPPPSRSQTSPQNPSMPPPKNQPPSLPSPPNNSSSSTPILTNPPPLPSPNAPPGTPTTPISPNGNKSSTLNPNVTAGVGNVNNGGGGGTKNGVVLPVAIVTSILVLSLVGLAIWYFRKKKRRTSGYGAGFVMPSSLTSSQMSESSYPWSPAAPLVYNSSGGHGFINSPPDAGGLGNSKSCFNYEDLYKVTNGFSEDNLLGEGGFGCVYKGCLPDGREVAVKQLKVGGSQGEREFRAEVEIIGRVHHRHLVSLVGYCIADNQRLLVYDYVPNNTLHYHLHEEGRPVMDWAIRVKVAAGAARGIAYLHEDCHPRIIHRDIKSSNILLDNNYEAQVSDFGLAKFIGAVTHVTTRVMGTFGYMAPEYAFSGKLTDRSDVYSFGVVLLELITGRKPVDSSQPLGDESLVEWARPLLTQSLETGNFDSLTDPRLEKSYNEREMFRMIETAAACIRHSAPMRPRMGLVVRALDGLANVDLSNGLKPGQSELFSAQSAEIRLFQRMAFGSQDYSSDFSNFSNFSRTSRNSPRDS